MWGTLRGTLITVSMCRYFCYTYPEVILLNCFQFYCLKGNNLIKSAGFLVQLVYFEHIGIFSRWKLFDIAVVLMLKSMEMVDSLIHGAFLLHNYLILKYKGTFLFSVLFVYLQVYIFPKIGFYFFSFLLLLLLGNYYY